MRITSLLFLAFVACGAARAAQLPVEVVETLDQNRLVVYLSEAQIDAIPAWQPGAGQPPMSLQAAVARALEWIRDRDLYTDARIYELKFKPVHNYEALNRWYYLVDLRLPGGRRHFIAVLPNGDVVPAMVEPGR